MASNYQSTIISITLVRLFPALVASASAGRAASLVLTFVAFVRILVFCGRLLLSFDFSSSF